MRVMKQSTASASITVTLGSPVADRVDAIDWSRLAVVSATAKHAGAPGAARSTGSEYLMNTSSARPGPGQGHGTGEGAVHGEILHQQGPQLIDRPGALVASDPRRISGKFQRGEYSLSRLKARKVAALPDPSRRG